VLALQYACRHIECFVYFYDCTDTYVQINMHEYVYMQQFMHLCIYVSSYMCIPKFRKDACTRMQIWNKPHAHHHVHARRSLCRCLQEQTTCMCMQRLDTSMLVDSYIPFWHTQRHVHNSCVCTQDMVMLLKRYSLF